jgi:tripartite-type tricarboxylate transporter receptor subunit TctC
MTRSMLYLTTLLAVMPFTPTAQGQAEYPNRPIHIIVPYPPGGTTDLIARRLAEKMTEDWKAPVVVENRPGANGSIGANAVAQANPDGYMLMMTALGGLGLGDLKRFAPVILAAAPPNVLVVYPGLNAKSLKELVALAQAQPGKISVGSSGVGTQSHLASALMISMTKIEVLHVPYKGAGQAIGDLVGGHVQVMMATLPAVEGHLKSERLRALAVTSLKRLEAAPSLPTMAESGLPGFEATGWIGLFAPAGTSKELVAKLNAECNRILTSADVKGMLTAMGAPPIGGTPEEFETYVRADIQKWDGVMQQAGIKVE